MRNIGALHVAPVRKVATPLPCRAPYETSYELIKLQFDTATTTALAVAEADSQVQTARVDTFEYQRLAGEALSCLVLEVGTLDVAKVNERIQTAVYEGIESYVAVLIAEEALYTSKRSLITARTNLLAPSDPARIEGRHGSIRSVRW